MIKFAFVIFVCMFLFFPKNAGAAWQDMEIRIGKRTFSATLADNDTAKAFLERLPMTLDMSEMNGNEKYFYLDQSLPSAPEKVGKIRAGDIMLYGDRCIVIFYKGFSTSYSYTRIGYIKDTSALESAVGKGGITVIFSGKR